MLKHFRPSLRESSPLLIIGLRLLDGVLVVVMLYLLVILYIGEWTERYELLGLLAFFMSMLIFHYMGLYNPWRGQGYVNEFKIIMSSWLIMMCLIFFLLFVFKVSERYSRFVLMLWLISTPLLHFMFHAAARKILRVFRSQGKNQRSAVIVGCGDLGLSLARYIEKISWSGIRVLGFFDDYRATEDLIYIDKKRQKILGVVSDLRNYLENNTVDFVYITLPMGAEKKIYEILNTCRTKGARIYFVPDLYVFHLLNGQVQSLGEVMLIAFNPDSIKKRFFDVFFSLLIILLSLPLILIISIIIKLQDGGPIFYRHRRITVTGKEFHCLKFRTMNVDSDSKLKEILENDPKAYEEWRKNFKLKKDPRVTFIGRFLRKTSLDELPQFINVLKGQMSVVGARPIVYEELYDYYKDVAPIYCSIKPGITGPWQVDKRSDTESYDKRVELDKWYVLNNSFWLDMKIIFKTLWCIIKGKGAY
ncbi:MAG: sugar transferase [Deltaproteobacteria bacterium]|nr:sugar transferase [Deltaproteobacteria bacterium]